MENIDHVCRHFKLMGENCDVNIYFTLRECFVHKREKATVYLNFENDTNINVELEEEKLKEYIYYLLPKKSGCFLSSSREYKLKVYFKEESHYCVVAQFVIDVISLEEKFCKYYKKLRWLYNKAEVVFNIHNLKIIVSLYYDKE